MAEKKCVEIFTDGSCSGNPGPGGYGIILRYAGRNKELSGGEKQKVAIARALISRPKVILADEPTGSLDEETAKEIMQVLKAINSLGTTIIMTTHNERLIQHVKGSRKISIKEHGVVHDEHSKQNHSEPVINKNPENGI